MYVIDQTFYHVQFWCWYKQTVCRRQLQPEVLSMDI